MPFIPKQPAYSRDWQEVKAEITECNAFNSPAVTMLGIKIVILTFVGSSHLGIYARKTSKIGLFYKPIAAINNQKDRILGIKKGSLSCLFGKSDRFRLFSLAKVVNNLKLSNRFS